MAIASGFALALGGPDWWHYNPVGHFFNSLHLWSVELFMALLVIHLWGKFWMAAWRGRRAMTWITGVVAFVASIVECFTGYVSQQNFDSQWISTSGKDAFNSVGVGAFFNVMNFGQMLMWHIVLLPIVLIAIVGAHVLLVRMRGVVAPDRRARRAGHRARAVPPARPGRGPTPRPWRGPNRRYDILKEGTIAAVVVLALTAGPGRAAVLPGRAAGHRRDLGPGRARRLPGHGGHRAERHQRDRHLRAALQQPDGQRPEAAVLPAEHPRRRPSRSTRAQDFVLIAAGHARAPPTRPWPPRWPPTGPPPPPSS